MRFLAWRHDTYPPVVRLPAARQPDARYFNKKLHNFLLNWSICVQLLYNGWFYSCCLQSVNWFQFVLSRNYSCDIAWTSSIRCNTGFSDWLPKNWKNIRLKLLQWPSLCYFPEHFQKTQQMLPACAICAICLTLMTKAHFMVDYHELLLQVKLLLQLQDCQEGHQSESSGTRIRPTYCKGGIPYLRWTA